jgi:hypothetical protein
MQLAAFSNACAWFIAGRPGIDPTTPVMPVAVIAPHPPLVAGFCPDNPADIRAIRVETGSSGLDEGR